ncbi:DEKNAAC102451 [Brettanomyces naardenensis]|uniref:DEKNAAC102451 n=1 Tax=Brettanomyces naardenensis TaxID=13370 RepID=A0A448YLL5_BRENA|nr:DEKNAAC102451 [Brettanomyces naardenensis]
MVDYSSWLKDVDDDTYLSKLAIPGTHDAAAYHSLAPPSVQCQGEDISEQLKNGVRFLDVRLSKNFLTLSSDEKDKDDLICCHGNFPVKLTGAVKFTEELENIYKFLEDHNSETVILSIKQEGNGKWDNEHDEFPTVFGKNYLDGHEDKWFLKDEIPQLKDARGKIVLFRRFGVNNSDNQGKFGIAANSWTYNTTYDDRGKFAVQDFCEFKSEDDIPKKADYVKDLLKKATDYNNTNSDPKLFVNFCSASNFFDFDTWPHAVAEGLQKANIGEDYKKGCGIVVLDYVNKDDWKSIHNLIDKNFN